MGGMSLWHWVIVGVVFLLLFGGNRFSHMMGDVAKGLKNFKKGMADEEDPAAPPRRLESDPVVETAATERARAADPAERREP